jgi:hypothetical protein
MFQWSSISQTYFSIVFHQFFEPPWSKIIVGKFSSFAHSASDFEARAYSFTAKVLP